MLLQITTPKKFRKKKKSVKCQNCKLALCVFRSVVKPIQRKKTGDKASQQGMPDSRSPSSDVMLHSRLSVFLNRPC